MPKKLTYISFQSLPINVRLSLVAQVLIEKWGYSIDLSAKRSDRAVARALSTFQRSNQLAGNGVVCEKTFNFLGLCEYSLK